jgi:enoyl-CoA hydratase/carnithine racemase
MIDAKTDGAVGRITLNKPESHNALDQAAMRALTDVLDDWAGRTKLRAIVLTGTGKSFCAGAALGDVEDADWSENPLTRACDALEAFPAPSIAALNGGVYGGGVELALSCDFRIGVEGMRAFVPPARLGIHYEPSGIARVVQRLGAQAARRMFLLAETFDSEALLAMGFLDWLVAPAGLESRSAEVLETLQGHAPLALRGMKRTILEISRGNVDGPAARARITECLASADHAEGLAAHKERRKPGFRGV